MKKITLLAFAFVAISFASCRKIYTCTCSVTSGSASYSQSETYTSRMSKSDAETKCSANNGSGVVCTIN